MKKRLLANLSSFISSYKRDVDDATFVGNFTFDTDFKEFVFSWSADRANNRTITSGTVILNVPDIDGGDPADVTLSTDVVARAKTKGGRRLYRVKFTENDVRYEMIVDADNKVIDRRG